MSIGGLAVRPSVFVSMGRKIRIKAAKLIEVKERVMACPLTLNNFSPAILLKRHF